MPPEMTDDYVEPRPTWPDALRVIHARNRQNLATASLLGGQVLSWRHLGREMLFMSPRSSFAEGVAIRGGIPVIFPQFGARGPGQRHGFARLSEWTPSSERQTPFRMSLVLAHTPAAGRAWPYPFLARLGANLGVDTLEIALAITNAGTGPFTFTCALHTYLRVADVTQAGLAGLEGCSYADATRGGAMSRQDAQILRFRGEIDRVYGRAPSALILQNGQDRLEITQAGFVDTVVWNPGDALAAAMPDLGEGNHRDFVCVEAACVEHPVHLGPGEEWKGSQTLRVLTAGPGRLG